MDRSVSTGRTGPLERPGLRRLITADIALWALAAHFELLLLGNRMHGVEEIRSVAAGNRKMVWRGARRHVDIRLQLVDLGGDGTRIFPLCGERNGDYQLHARASVSQTLRSRYLGGGFQRRNRDGQAARLVNKLGPVMKRMS